MPQCLLQDLGACLPAGLLVGLLSCLASSPAGAQDDAAADEQVLRAARVETDPAGLLAFFRQHTPSGADETRLKGLVRQLGDDSFEAREQASRLLVAAGAQARELLRQARRDPDIEVVRRAEECLKQIECETSPAVFAAAVRLAARHKPAGAAAVLLAYLPYAEDDSVAEEVGQALAALALRDGKPDPALLSALSDPAAVQRAATARAPEVRLRAALALAAARNKDAVPVLITLLDVLPPHLTGLAEDFLYRLAGDQAPTELSGDDAASRRRYRQAWEAWWREHGARVEPARVAEAARRLNCTLVILLDAGRVVDLDESNRPRWQVGGLELPLDAQALPGDRVLVAEYKAGRVSERNRKGEVVWEKKIDEPLAAQRLPNGHTFIAARREVVEVDRDGKVVFSYSRPGGEVIMKAQKLANGDVALVTLLGGARFVRVDRSGKEVRSFGVDLRTSGGRVDVLTNGHVLIPEKDNNRVVEYDADGKVVWEASAEQPIAAVRLPNGHTLVTSMTQPRAVELNRAGKEVWEYRADTRVTRAFRH